MEKKRERKPAPSWSRYWKICTIMKLTLLMSVFFVFTTLGNGFSQQKVSMQLGNTTIKKALNEFQRLTNKIVIYSDDDFAVDKEVRADFEEVELDDFLRSILKGSGMTYQLMDDYILILSERKSVTDDVKTRCVKGWVYDVNKQPMPGVTIKLVGTTVGTATNTNGWFALELPLKKGALEFTFVGYKKKIVEFTEQKMDTLHVVMEVDVADLDEVVVRAYGSQKKREVVSAISTVTAEEMKELPAASISSMLQGRLAGVNIIQQSGAPGSAAVIAVRGFNSLLVSGASDGQPLWVVDGVPMHSFISPATGTNTLADLDPAMIESVQVLKDAAASIYGSRAGNGVILVTTKKGKEGKAQFSANVSYSISQLMEYPQQTGGRMERWLDLIQKRHVVKPERDYLRDVNVYPTSYTDVWGMWATYDSFWGSGDPYTATLNRYLQDSLDPFYNNSQNWWKYVFNTGKVVNANIQASGGSPNFKYIVGAGFYDEDGIMINSGYSRFNLRSNLTAQLSKKLRMDTRIYLSYVDRTMSRAKNSTGRYEGMDVTPDAQRTYVAASKELKEEWLSLMNNVKDRTDDYRLMASMFMEYQIWKGFTLSASGNVDYSQGNMNKFTPSSMDQYYHENISRGQIYRAISISTEELLHYNKNINEKHNIDILLGVNANKNQDFTIGGWGKGGASDYVYYYDPDSSPSIKNRYGTKYESMTSYKSDFTEKVMVSYFGRLGYNYKQRYLLEFTLRRDGSSTFGEKNRWANFPSVALGWTFSEEPFIKRLTGSWLNWGKIRGSYGTSGQVFTLAYLTHGLLNVISKDYFQGNAGVETNVPVSPHLKWEKTEQYDLGLDMDMFNYRVNVKLDYYYKYTSSLFYRVPVPSSLYIRDYRYENALAVSNEGIELELQADVLRDKALSWRMRFNVARNWNRLEKTYNKEDVGGVLGCPLYGMYVSKNNGFFESEDDVPRYYQSNGEWVFLGGGSTANGVSGMLGDYNLSDLNGDNYAGDLYFAGSPLPLAHGGWVNELRWKNFDLNVLVNFSLGRKMINERVGSLSGEGPKFLDYRDIRWWTEPRCDANVPRMGLSVNTNLDTNIEKVHSLSMKQVTLGYNLPDVWARKAGLSAVRLFTTVENLFYLSNYSGENPEIIDVYSGRDQGKNYPLPRKWTLGLTLNF